MKKIIQFSDNSVKPQLLQLYYQEDIYHFKLIHATLDELAFSTKQKSAGFHSHDVYHIVLYTEGQNEFYFCGKNYPSVPGQLVISVPEETHVFSALAPGKAIYSEITFSFERNDGKKLCLPIMQLLSLYFGLDLKEVSFPIIIDRNSTTGIYHHIEKIIDWIDSPGQFSKIMALSEIENLLMFLVREIFLKKSSIIVKPLEKVKDFIKRHCFEKIAVSELAGMINYSSGHFYRAFKKAYHISPIAYQQKLRIEAAAILLKSTNLGCKEIAARVGYEDVYHFSKIFRNLTGLPPGQYRKK